MYMVFDLETETHTYMKRKASPFCPDNYVVASGWKLQKEEKNGWRYFDSRVHNCNDVLCVPDDATILVGFNIKFDLLWIWRNESLERFFKRGGVIWDCQYAQYLLKAQHPKYWMVSLDETAPEYGGTTKVDLMKAWWASGKQTSEAHSDVLQDYLVGTNFDGGDIRNTELVYLGQIERAKELGMLTAIQQRMEGLLFTTECEYNGLYVDMITAQEQMQELKEEQEKLQHELQPYLFSVPLQDGESTDWEFKMTSGHHLSALIFGGAVAYTVKKHAEIDGVKQYRTKDEVWPIQNGIVVPPGNDVVPDKFLSGKKKGEDKTKKVKVPDYTKPIIKTETRILDVPGYLQKSVVKQGRSPQEGWETLDKDARGVPIFRTGGPAIELLADYGDTVPFIKTLTRLFAVNKELSTYYIATKNSGNLSGMLTLVEPDTNILHHQLNHTSTITSRLSSSNPNMQNIPRAPSKVKKMFKSRFPDGIMMESDYSQLEVVYQGVLTGDENLIKELNMGIDFHCARVARKHGIEYEVAVHRCKDSSYIEYTFWNSERTKCKIFSFQLQYGAGAATIARETGMTEDEVRRMMDDENKAYPGVAKFFGALTRQIQASSKPFRDHVTKRVYRRGIWVSPTGIRYTWRSYDAPEFMRKKGILDTFSPPEIKNYPVQGGAAEIVQIACGKLFRHFINNNRYNEGAYLVNTVHDCVWVDSKKEIAETVKVDLKQIMENIPKYYKEIFNIDLPVQFKVEVSSGPDMFNLTH